MKFQQKYSDIRRCLTIIYPSILPSLRAEGKVIQWFRISVLPPFRVRLFGCGAADGLDCFAFGSQ